MKVELDYQENHTLCLCCRSYLKNANDVKIAVRFPEFYQIFCEMSTIVIVVTNYVSNVAQQL